MAFPFYIYNIAYLSAGRKKKMHGSVMDAWQQAISKTLHLMQTYNGFSINVEHVLPNTKQKEMDNLKIVL